MGVTLELQCQHEFSNDKLGNKKCELLDSRLELVISDRQ